MAKTNMASLYSVVAGLARGRNIELLTVEII
jgi:hypothetical protein